MSVLKTSIKMSSREQSAYDLGFYEGRNAAAIHGRWECTYDENMGETDVTCSHCKALRTIIGCYVTSFGESCYFDDNYCPNCGAKMDGDGNG